MSRPNSTVDAKKNEQRTARAVESSNSFSLVPLLISGQSISADARQALRENRLKDAARMIMESYGLSCDEAGDLLNVAAC
jgi:hypothetical protein